MHRLMCLVVLAGCASTPPDRHELRDGVPVRPAPVFVTPSYTPAGAGLPEYMPGPPEPMRIEPNPRPTRLLPPTREPGIWASDVPNLSDDGKPEPLVLGVRLPYWHMQDEPEDREHTRWCAAKVDALLRKTMTPSEISSLSKEETRCLAMRMYDLCSKVVWDPALKMDETLSRHARSVLGSLIQFTEALKDQRCPKEAATSRVGVAYDNARKAW